MDPFIGEIRVFPYNFVPLGWLACEGQILSIGEYTALFSLVGTTFGGDGRSTFALPDLRGYSAMNQGTGPGLSNRWYGKKGGAKAVTLSQASIPSHEHRLSNVAADEGCSTGSADAVTPIAGVEAANAEATAPARFLDTTETTTMKDDIVSVSGVTDSSGTGEVHNNQMPFQAIGYHIATDGLYPTRP